MAIRVDADREHDDGVDHAADLGLRQPVDVQGLDELVHAASGHAGGVASLRPR